MDNDFTFLAKAKPATLYKLLEKMPLEDVAIVLAGVPTSLGIQVMAYFPEARQAELMPAMREARRVEPARAARTVTTIRQTLLAAKKAAGSAAPATPALEGEKPPLAERFDGTSPFGKPTPWTPRAATTSPINGPALPGAGKPVAGDPMRSPLARAGLMDLLGRAQEKLLPKRGGATAKPPSAARMPSVPKTPKPGERPAAREGVVRSVRVERTPRVIGPRPKADAPGASGGARRMDGKAILAAILREAGSEIRDTVREVEPALFRDLHKRMFYFDDLIFTEDRALAQVFTAAPAAESALALKFAAPALRERVLRAVSPGRAEALRDVGPGKAGLDAIEAAQKKVLDVALQLQAAGRILIDPRDPDLAGGV